MLIPRILNPLLYIPLFCFKFKGNYFTNIDPPNPQFYIVKLGFTGVYIIFFLISAQKI